MLMTATDGLNLALSQIDSWIDQAAVSAAAVVVRWRGEEIAEHYAGSLATTLPVERSTIFGLASVTKPITAACVLALVDDGKVGLDEPIARFVPGFGKPSTEGTPQWEAARALITVRQVLSHTSGMPEDLAPDAVPLRNLPTLDDITDAMVAVPLAYQPGTALRYSNAGYGVLGRLVNSVTGQDIWAFAEERLLRPMGLTEIHARPREAVRDRIAEVIDARAKGAAYEPYNSTFWRDLAIPWGGLYGTAADAARWAESIHTGADLPLSGAARRMMTSDQAGGVSGGLQMMNLTWHPAFWGLGWEVKGTKRRHWTGDYTSNRTYCHWGAAGTLVWVDPEIDLTVAAFGNRTTFNGWPFSPIARWARLSNAIVAAVTS
jgi:CubicO group peptidase (beta-lactamase class C family)